MGRAPCCDKEKVKRGPWSPEEDTALKSYVETYGTGGNWIAFPQKAGLRRCGKSCRLRWLNYLRPDIKHGGFTEEEDSIICTLYKKIGSRWSVIAGQLQGRTDNDVKNYWNTKLKKKLMASSHTVTITTTNNNGNTSNPAAPPYLPPPIPPMKAERFTYTSSTVPFPPDNTGYGHMNPTSSFSAAPAAALVDSPMSFANDYLVSTPRGASSAASSSVTGDNSSCCNSSSFPDGDWGDVDLLMDMVGSGSSTDLFNSYGACGELVLPTYGFLGSGGLWGSASGECKTQQGLNQSITYS